MPLEIRKCLIVKGKRGTPDTVESKPLSFTGKFNHYGLYKRQLDGSLQWCSDYDKEGLQQSPYGWRKA